jgi:hypothetical protein
MHAGAPWKTSDLKLSRQTVLDTNPILEGRLGRYLRDTDGRRNATADEAFLEGTRLGFESSEPMVLLNSLHGLQIRDLYYCKKSVV